MKKIAVIGAGAWGTALAITAHNAGNQVIMWAFENETVQEINNSQRTMYLPSAHLPETLKATSDMNNALTDVDFVLFATPAQFNRSVFEQMNKYLKDDTPVVLCAKGIELKTGLLLSEVVHEINPKQKLAVLSGPGFAVELARKCPTAVTIASDDISLAKELCEVLKTDYFRPYSSSDMITPQICGALKNVMAIASGISDGCQFGDNARAALITRGLAEMARFAVMLGGQRDSVAGLSGVGDLMLTANSHQSRNYSCGFEIGQAGWAKPVLEKSTKTVEGVATAASVLKRASDLKIEMPICQVVEEIIYHEKPIKEALLDLLNRPLKTEQEF
ncbi:MAG: NAD(P)-dependent glycerol-3-phosphate dehydrogenase [Alphaproteobacteria bacterium]|nr:NAD(P)-dependent glycerol-3-phosphate dehydrogenase [Alphaproteobacteria bacterium]